MKLFGPSLWSRLAAFLIMRKYTEDAAREYEEKLGVADPLTSEVTPTRFYEAKSISMTLGGERFDGLELLSVQYRDRARKQRLPVCNEYSASAAFKFEWWISPGAYLTRPVPFFQVHHALSPREERIEAAERKRQRKRALRLARRGVS